MITTSYHLYLLDARACALMLARCSDHDIPASCIDTQCHLVAMLYGVVSIAECLSCFLILTVYYCILCVWSIASGAVRVWRVCSVTQCLQWKRGLPPCLAAPAPSASLPYAPSMTFSSLLWRGWGTTECISYRLYLFIFIDFFFSSIHLIPFDTRSRSWPVLVCRVLWEQMIVLSVFVLRCLTGKNKW